MRIFRLFVDDYSDGHHNLFLKIDVSPASLDIADSYYLFDFFKIPEGLVIQENQTTPFIAIELLKYWKIKIENLKFGETNFLPSSLYDEGGEGYFVEKVKNGFNFKKSFSEQLSGWSINIDDFDKNWKDFKFEFTENERFISEEIVTRGIELSIQDLSKMLS